MFAPSSFVTDFNCTDGHYNGHDKEQDSTDQASCHGSPFDVLRQIVFEIFTDCK